MKATLYKLKEGWVLCSDEELPVGYRGSMFFTKGGFLTETMGIHLAGLFRKVLTQSPDFSLLSEEDAKRIGWFDVRKLSDFIHLELYHDISDASFDDGFEKGFQKALELTADRRFTEDDLLKAISLAKVAKTSDGLINMDNWISDGYEGAESAYSSKEIIQSLSQPKSWEVEVDGNLRVIKILNTTQ